MRARIALAVVVTCAACATTGAVSSLDDGGADGATLPDASAPPDGGGEGTADGSATDDAGDGNAVDGATCIDVTDQVKVPIATALQAGEATLTFTARSTSKTSWEQKGNEALVLEVYRGASLLGHVVMHQGAIDFTYGMHAGALAAGDIVSVKVSALSAASATKRACVGGAVLAAGDEGVANAPILTWPVTKRFDDLPIVLGWSKSRKHYELVYTNENGGTVALCGGGASGMQAEIARWGRGADIEGIYTYSGTPQWERCTGTLPVTAGAPRMEAAHPILYYGDGHNRLFESRGGYGQTCGTGSDAKADGDLDGWNTKNPGNDAANDGPFVVTIRPLPVDLDAIGYAKAFGRREALLDVYAPWLYRVTDGELKREGKVDGAKCLPMDRYLFVDVQAADVNGSGDRVCALAVSGGFVLRVKTQGGQVLSGPQMTADYFTGNPGWKRLALPLDRAYTASELTGMTFDAYDNDGIYFLAIGDAFMPRANGDNGATLEVVRKGAKSIGVYVDDGNSGCVGGVNPSGPGDAGYPCVGGLYDFTP